MKRRYEVSFHEHGMKLLAFLKQKWAKPSVKSLKRAIDNKRCRVNGQIELFSTRTLAKKNVVEIEVIELPSLELRTLYEDEHLIICNKPVGLVCENKNFPFVLAHRLDKETSGVLMLAKNEVVRHKIIDLFMKRVVKKEYLALVDGAALKKEGSVHSFLTKKYLPQGQVYYASSHQGEEAITSWACLGLGNQSSLLRCEPITGKTHQIRVHMKEIGHPILGDTLYSKKSICPAIVHRYMLHAYRLSFPHPVTEELIDITAPLPADFIQAMEAAEMTTLIDQFSVYNTKKHPKTVKNR